MTPTENRLKASRLTSKLKRWLADPLTTFFIMLVVFSTLGLGLVNSFEYRQLAQCIADYNDQLAVATQQRALLVDEDRRLDLAERELDRQDLAAFRDLITSLRAAAGNEQAAAAAQQRYLAIFDGNTIKRDDLYNQRLQIAQERKNIKVPEQPSLACE